MRGEGGSLEVYTSYIFIVKFSYYIYAFNCFCITYFNLLYFHMHTQSLSAMLKARSCRGRLRSAIAKGRHRKGPPSQKARAAYTGRRNLNLMGGYTRD